MSDWKPDPVLEEATWENVPTLVESILQNREMADG